MTNTVKDILAKEDAIEHNMSPTGVKYSIKKVANSALFCAVPSKGAPLSGLGEHVHFTSPKLVKDQINLVLGKMWDMSDKVSAKSTNAEKSKTD